MGGHVSEPIKKRWRRGSFPVVEGPRVTSRVPVVRHSISEIRCPCGRNFYFLLIAIIDILRVELSLE
jgi:hypothetical protein